MRRDVPGVPKLFVIASEARQSSAALRLGWIASPHIVLARHGGDTIESNYGNPSRPRSCLACSSRNLGSQGQISFTQIAG